MAPHLITALTEPLTELEKRFIDATPIIERWFRLEWMEHTPVFYSAVTIRNAGFKLAPVTANLFPSDWHYLTPQMLPLAVQAAMAAIEKICPEAKNLLLLAKNNATDLPYLMNLAQLQRLFRQAGLTVRIGSIDPKLKKTVSTQLTDNQLLTLEPVIRRKNRLGLHDFDPCTLLLNNDLATGVPGILEDLHAQYLLPPLHAGLHSRRHSTYWNAYEIIAKRFCKLVGIDPWLILPMHSISSTQNLMDSEAFMQLTQHVDAVLTRVKRKHKEFGIQEKPFVVIRTDDCVQTNHLSNQCITVADAIDMQALRPQFIKLQQSRSTNTSRKNSDQMVRACDIFIQEGLRSSERVRNTAVEPVVYLMDRYVVGGFYQVNEGQDTHASSSATELSTSYIPLAFAQNIQPSQEQPQDGASAPNRFYMYGVVARLAMLASSYELEAMDPLEEIYN